MKTFKYAAHFIRWGIYRSRYPLIELSPERKILSLRSFTHEEANTTFVDGVISLSSPADHPNNSQDTIDVEIEELCQLLAESDKSALRVYLPKLIHRPSEIGV